MPAALLFLDEAVLTSTHNLCFRARIRKKKKKKKKKKKTHKKNLYHRKPQFYFIKVGGTGLMTCFPDG